MTQTETRAETQVREAQEAHDAEHNPDHDGQVAPGQTAVFDATDYTREDLQIPKIDGQTIDRIAVKFTGEVFLERSDPSDVALYNELRLGREVKLLVEGNCSSTKGAGATDRDGALDVVVGQKSIKVTSLMKPASADWVTDA